MGTFFQEKKLCFQRNPFESLLVVPAGIEPVSPA